MPSRNLEKLVTCGVIRSFNLGLFNGNILGYESSGSTDWLESWTSPKLSFAINGKMFVHSPIILPISNHLSPMVKLRAGLRVVPEWSYERQWEAHFSAHVLRLWYICGLAWSKTTFWKNQSEKWTLCGLHTFRPFPLFQFFSLFWRARNL